MGLSHSPSIVTNGLVLCLDAANPKSYPGSGTTWYDLSGNGSHGTLTNGPIYNSDNKGNIIFDGSNDGVGITNTPLLSLNTMTISSWNYSTNFNHNGFMFEKTTNGSVNTQYSLFFNGNSTIYYRTYGLSTTDLTFGWTGVIINSNWVNVVATFDGTYKRIFINGVQQSISTALTGTITQNTTGAAYVGIYGNFAGYPFNGRISQNHIYNRALSAAEIAQNFAAHRGRYGI